MKLLTQKQARELDILSLESSKIKGVQLMEAAGKIIADFLMDFIQNIDKESIGIVCGKGNNGGDGFASATFLHSKKYRIQIFCICSLDDLSNDSQYFANQCLEMGISIQFSCINLIDELKNDFIIDGLLGTGVKGPVRAEIIPIINTINSSKGKVISIDIPSGLHADIGIAQPEGIIADYTITMGHPKVGLIMRDGPSLSGEIHVADIGFPDKALNNLKGLKWKLLQEKDISSLLKPINNDTNKYKQGKVLIIAGSKGMTGAAALCSLGAFRVGAGLVISAAPSSINDIYEKKITEAMTLICEDDNHGYFLLNNFDEVSKKFEWADVVIIGPGIGCHNQTINFAKKIIRTCEKPMIIDADGLRVFDRNNTLFSDIKAPFVITPHYGELSRILDEDVKIIKNQFTSIFDDFMEKFNGVLVAKNAPSCILHKNNVSINSSGNPGLATAGTGDVLAGMIGGFVAQGLNIEDASKLAVNIHGKAADNYVIKNGMRGMIASDILNEIPLLISDYEY